MNRFYRCPLPTRRGAGLIWLWALLAVAVFATGLYAGVALFSPTAGGPQTPPDISGVYVEEPLDLVDFELIGDDGERFDAEDFAGRWTFVYFGYTFCPDACPLTLAQLDKAQDLLVAENADQDNAYLLISVDPARDTPQRLAEYVDSFDPKFRGATGAREQIDALTDSLGIYYQINEPEAGKDYYLVDHSSALVLINPEAKVQAILTPPFTPQQLAQNLNDIKAARVQ